MRIDTDHVGDHTQNYAVQNMSWMKTWRERLQSRLRGRETPDRSFPVLFSKFKEILALNTLVLERIATTNSMLSGDYLFDQQFIHTASKEITAVVERLVYHLDSLAPGKYPGLHAVFNRIQSEIQDELSGRRTRTSGAYVLPYERVTRYDIDDTGGKNAALAEVGNMLGLATPEGFAITAAGYHAFLDHNGLRPVIEDALRRWREGTATLQEVSKDLRERILAGALPEALHREIASGTGSLVATGPAPLVFRSSAVAEDGEQSFAGQYTSVLNVALAGTDKAYREVVASLFSESALEYARTLGIKDHEITMAVACQKMIDARVSGVLYTHNPAAPEKEQMLITATWGLGAPAVAGEARTDQFTVSREDDHPTLAVNVVRKASALRLKRGGGTRVEPVPTEQQTLPALTQEEVRRLADTALEIERYFRKPQDIEFAFDQKGRLVILQARRLSVRPDQPIRPQDLADLHSRYPVLMKNQGVIARKGIAFGRVRIVRKEEDLVGFPEGGILVARYASPVFAKVLAHAAGIITDVGAITGHLATVAREFRVPAIFNCGDATRILPDGAAITLDAEENIIYQGTVKELNQYRMVEAPMEEAYEFRLLRRVLRKIEPLRLLDPAERNFVPEACQSLHDITRFIHEKAVQTLIDFHVYNMATPQSVSGRLELPLPLDLVIIDIGGGLVAGARGRVGLEAVASVPMCALLEGMTRPGVWSNEPMSVDFAGFMSSLTRTFSTELADPRHVGRNLAVLSREYANISLRLGYHFTMIDAYVSDRISDNYVYFRFFGGVTEEERRSRRARLLNDILLEKDFRVEVHGDLVIGRATKLDAEGMRRRLSMLGVLIGFTRQLDVRMVDEERVSEFKQHFNKLLEDDHE